MPGPRNATFTFLSLFVLYGTKRLLTLTQQKARWLQLVLLSRVGEPHQLEWTYFKAQIGTIHFQNEHNCSLVQLKTLHTYLPAQNFTEFIQIQS